MRQLPPKFKKWSQYHSWLSGQPISVQHTLQGCTRAGGWVASAEPPSSCARTLFVNLHFQLAISSQLQRTRSILVLRKLGSWESWGLGFKTIAKCNLIKATLHIIGTRLSSRTELALLAPQLPRIPRYLSPPSKSQEPHTAQLIFSSSA